MPQADALQRVHRDYMEHRILTAKSVVIVDMLYGVALRSLEASIGYLKSGEPMERSREVSRAQEAINELTLALDHSVGASFTETLAALYGYAQTEILKGHVQQSEGAFRNAIAVLTPLQEAWTEVCKRENQTEMASVPDSAPEPVELREEVQRFPASDPRAVYQPAQGTVSRDWDC